ncbi:methyltransferase domain-containing protein [Candidatus Saccharibacteria bacterium]|nr:methyltransferase domain-containing protein [Candidatus Saccharibacteria bacterium]
MKYIAIVGRQPEISIAEIEALFGGIKRINSRVVGFESEKLPDIDRLGGSLKIGQKIEGPTVAYMMGLPEGKITLGVSDYSKNATQKTATMEALKLKKILIRHGRSVRVVSNRDAVLSTATTLHNGMSGKNERKVELLRVNNNEWYKVVGVQDIDAYSKRDQARPARDAKVGMLPPKLAQILINLCGRLPKDAVVLDPFCGTGVVLQEAMLMGQKAYGTDINERMIEYSERNLAHYGFTDYRLAVGDATRYQWQQPIDAVACEGYLGKPFSRAPSEIEIKTQRNECGAIFMGFLKNLSGQIQSGTPVTVAMPAWLGHDGWYERLFLPKTIDEIDNMGYNVSNKSREGLLYYREGQAVARDIIILRKK